MPILDPRIQRLIQESGLGKSNSDQPIQEILNNSGLDVSSLVSNLKDLVEGAANESVKIRSIENGLKMHGVLRDQAPPPTSVNIIIQDPNAVSVNPILIPREVAA